MSFASSVQRHKTDSENVTRCQSISRPRGVVVPISAGKARHCRIEDAGGCATLFGVVDDLCGFSGLTLALGGVFLED